MTNFEPQPITADDVRNLRNALNSSIALAKRKLIIQSLISALNQIEEKATTEEKVDWLLRRYKEELVNEYNGEL